LSKEEWERKLFTAIMPHAPISIEVPAKPYLIAIVITKKDAYSHSTESFDRYSILLFGAPHLNDVVAVAILEVPTLRIGFGPVAWIGDGRDGMTE
jgi:hypothetical protein